jgi:hypothetical protein
MSWPYSSEAKLWSKGKDQTAVAASLGVAVDILKQVYSECPSFDEIVPALISAGIHALPVGPVGYRTISVYHLCEMPMQSCGQIVSAPLMKAGARLNAHTELRTKRQRLAQEAI